MRLSDGARRVRVFDARRVRLADKTNKSVNRVFKALFQVGTRMGGEVNALWI